MSGLNNKAKLYSDRDHPPAMLTPLWESIPAGLRARDQWVAWELRWDDGRGQWAKIPLCVTSISMTTGYDKARSNDRSTWAAFERVQHAWRRAKAADNPLPTFTGPGFVFAAGGGVLGIDLDGCRNPLNGDLTETAFAVMRQLPGYWEFSPSGTGIKGFFLGELPQGWTGKKAKLPSGEELEVYDRGRYFCVTGCCFRSGTRDLTPCGDGFATFVAEHFPTADGKGTTAASTAGAAGGGATLTDDEVIDKLTRTAKNAAKVARLWSGDTSAHGGDDSRADQALANHIAFYVGVDGAAQLDRVFRRSGLYRPKWDERHGEHTYGAETIRKALAGTKDFYSPPASRRKAITTGKPIETPVGVNERPDDPHRLARGFLNTVASDGPPYPIRYWRGEFHRYAGGAYVPVPDDDLRAEVTAYTRGEFERQHGVEMALWAQEGGGDDPPTVRVVSRNLVGNVIQAIGGNCLLSAAVDAPAWVDGATGPDPDALLPVTNGLLDLEAATAGRADCLLPASKSFFTSNAVSFAFDPTSPPPALWLEFLSRLWPDDPQSVAVLQEWFGYSLTPDTRQQKILFMVGPKRGGKGTVARVLRELVGPGNVAGPTLGGLTTNFGLSALMGKSLAIVPDARLGNRQDAAVITERLLSISGEDAITIDRKHLSLLTVRLRTRFVIMSNELPRLGDSSGALCGRLILLRLTRSWFGSEDTSLFDRLRAELPGILLWAIEGWRRLRERGRFVQPASGADLVEDMEALCSPVGTFVRDRCVLLSESRVEVSELYREWRTWCEQHGRKEPGTEETFGRDLRAAVPVVNKSRPRTPEGRLYFYTGIRLRTGSDPDPGPSGPGGPSDQPMRASRETTADGDTARGEPNSNAMGGRMDRLDHDDLFTAAGIGRSASGVLDKELSL